MYTIYHIPGVKIGCSKKVEHRVAQQGYNSYEVLEVHEDIEVASQRELELQKQYGYATERGYIHMIEMNKIGAIKGGRNSQMGQRNRESGHASTLGKKMTEQNTKTKVHCPHCGIESNYMILKRWHFDKCKYKLNN